MIPWSVDELDDMFLPSKDTQKKHPNNMINDKYNAL